MCVTDKESFFGGLNDWHKKWEKFFNERTIDPIKGKSYYTHKRLRSAFKSLKTNLPWLYVYQENTKLGIPNTTNKLEGLFSHLKKALRNHNGLSEKNKKKFINRFFKV
jgi:hypothetical protein